MTKHENAAQMVDTMMKLKALGWGAIGVAVCRPDDRSLVIIVEPDGGTIIGSGGMTSIPQDVRDVLGIRMPS